jgi:Ca2+-binding RTX toxin-like protein
MLDGGTGNDTASYEDNWGGVFINLGAGRGYGNAAQGDTLIAIENLRGGSFGDALLGDAGVNRLEGLGGDDVLIGGLGADILDGGSGSDFASYEDNWGGVFINLAAGRGYGNAAEGDLLIGIENLRGGHLNDAFVGDAGVNRIEGMAGDDVLIGGFGADVLVGGDGRDTASYEDNSGGVFINLLDGRGYGNAAEGDVLIGIEDLRGGIFADGLLGDDGANRLAGGLGADTLYGLGGADTFVFDTAPSAANADTINDFVGGVDRIELARSSYGALALGTLATGAFTTGAAATTAEHRIVFDAATGRLLYDADGNGAGAAVLIATLQGTPTVSAADFLVT